MSLMYEKQLNFASISFQALIDPEHRLVKLSQAIDWAEIHGRLRGYYSTVGRRALPLRLMVGLHFLKHLESMSDEQCVDRVRGDLYWMAFCGVETEGLEGKYRHLDRSSMGRFRGRIGDQGFSEVEDIIREYLIKMGEIKPSEMTTDSTCMEKNVAYPLDSHLLDKGRRNLLKAMDRLEELGIEGVQGLRSFSRRAKRLIIMMVKLGKDRAERIEAGTLELARQAVHVIGKSEQMIEVAERRLKHNASSVLIAAGIRSWIRYLEKQKELLQQVVRQARERFKGNHIADKIYSLHEPQVIVVRKGKRSRRNEYGCKVNLSICNKGYIVSHEEYFDNRSDTALLEPALQAWDEKTGELPRQLNADRGYGQREENLSRGRINKIKRIGIPNRGKSKNPDSETKWYQRGQSVRASIEATIGHLKTDHRVNRSRYSGCRGDKINMSLAVMAWNLKKLAANTS